MAGLPPFAGFYGKMLIWASLLEDIYLFNDFLSISLLLTNLVTSLIIIFYYMRLVVLVYLGERLFRRAEVYPYTYNQQLYGGFASNYRRNIVFTGDNTTITQTFAH